MPRHIQSSYQSRTHGHRAPSHSQTFRTDCLLHACSRCGAIRTYSPLARHTPTSPSSPPATIISPSQSIAKSLSPNTLPLSLNFLPSPALPRLETENRACLGDLISQIWMVPAYVAAARVNCDLL